MAYQPIKLIFFLLFIFITYSSPSFATLTDFIYKGCANQKFQDPNQSQNLKSLYTTLISQSSTTNFYKTTANGLTGLYQCRGDLSAADCHACVAKTPQTVERVCSGGDPIAARVQLDGCYLRYEAVGFPTASSTDLLFKQCGSTRASGSGFDERLESALAQIEKGVGGDGKGYYAGAYESVYVLGQCEGGLGSGECVNCVKAAADNVRTACGSSISGHVFLQQCYISYTYYPNGVPGSGTGGGGGGIATGATETGGNGGGRRHDTQKLVAIVIGGLAGLFLGIAFLMVLRSAFKKKKEKHSYGGY